MSLRPIPRRMLTDTVAVFVPTGIDRYQQPSGTTYTIAHVHIQNTNETRKTADNTEVTLRSLLFIDGRYSTPRLDMLALQESAQRAEQYMTLTVTDKRRNVTGPYTVQTVDAVPDERGNIHHYELGLV